MTLMLMVCLIVLTYAHWTYYPSSRIKQIFYVAIGTCPYLGQVVSLAFTLATGHYANNDVYIIEAYSPFTFNKQFGFYQDILGEYKVRICTVSSNEHFQLWVFYIGLETKCQGRVTNSSS